jgi:hypothetical protein
MAAKRVLLPVTFPGLYRPFNPLLSIRLAVAYIVSFLTIYKRLRVLED